MLYNYHGGTGLDPTSSGSCRHQIYADVNKNLQAESKEVSVLPFGMLLNMNFIPLAVKVSSSNFFSDIPNEFFWLLAPLGIIIAAIGFYLGRKSQKQLWFLFAYVGVIFILTTALFGVSYFFYYAVIRSSSVTAALSSI